VIKSFASRKAEDIYDGTNSRYARLLPIPLHAKAKRLLDQINAATQVETLKVPPSNKLSKLSGDLAGFWRIKIDKQWAIIFHWDKGNAIDVDIIDYH
jgi:proteic killer suppression protein